MEVRSEPSFTMNMARNPFATHPSMSNMRLTVTPDGTAVYKPIIATPPAVAETVITDGPSSSSPANFHGLNVGSSGELVKKKRGRPRKYGSDGNTSLSLTSMVPCSAVPPGFASLSERRESSQLSLADPMKKAKSKALSSGKKEQLIALGLAGVGFTPHVITVKPGEDLSSRIMSFSQHGPRDICVLSANGVISNVTLRQPASSGGTVTYEGRFEILSLSGSYLLLESGGQRSRTGGLSVSLAGPDGRVIGGGVAGLLMAASPVQVVVGSFLAHGKKEPKNADHFDDVMTSDRLPSGGNFYAGGEGAAGGGGGAMVGGSSSPSRGTPSGSSGGPPSPFHQGTMNNISWN